MSTPDNDILAKAVESLKSQQVPAGPPASLADSTAQKLTQASNVLVGAGRNDRILRPMVKFAAVAAALVLCGYAVGRLTVPAGPDVEQLRAGLEHSLLASIAPAIRQELLEETDRRLQVALAQTAHQIVSDLTEQYRSDLNQFAIQTVAASNLATNRLLARLVESIEAAQTQERRSVAAALQQIERNRLEDSTQLATGLETLAYHTQDQLQQTRQDVVRLLAGTVPGTQIREKPQSPNPSTERSKQ